MELHSSLEYLDRVASQLITRSVESIVEGTDMPVFILIALCIVLTILTALLALGAGKLFKPESRISPPHLVPQ